MAAHFHTFHILSDLGFNISLFEILLSQENKQA